MPRAEASNANITRITANARLARLRIAICVTANPTVAQPALVHTNTCGPSSTPNTMNTSESSQVITNPTAPATAAITSGISTGLRPALRMVAMAPISRITISAAVIANNVAGSHPCNKLTFISHCRIRNSSHYTIAQTVVSRLSVILLPWCSCSTYSWGASHP